MKKRLIPMSFDLVFKKMFGDNEHKERTALLVSTLLNIPYNDLVNNIELLPTEKRVRNKKDKRQSQDVIVKIILSINEKISLEMNMNYDESLKNRNIHYLSGMFYNQLKNKEDYSMLEPCIQINFNRVYTDNTNKIIFDKYTLRNEYGNELTEKIRIYNLNIDACHKIIYNNSINNYDKDLHEIIKYGAMLMETDYANLKKMLEEFKMKKELKEDILDVMEEYSEDEDLGLWYDEEEEKRKIYEGSLKIAKKQAQKEGMEKGIKEGIKEEKIKVVKQMLNKKFDIDTISEVVQLPIDEIKELANN